MFLLTALQAPTPVMNSNSSLVPRVPWYRCDAHSNVHESLKNPVQVLLSVAGFSPVQGKEILRSSIPKAGSKASLTYFLTWNSNPFPSPRMSKGVISSPDGSQRSDAGEHEASSLQTGKDFVS